MAAVNTCDTKLEHLENWIRNLIKSAKNDTPMLVSWFEDTKEEPFSIVGGWMEGFSKDYADILCISESDPSYAMCIKVVVNNGPYLYTDFEILNMPVDKDGRVDDTCLALDRDDDPSAAAAFILNEWERIMKDYSKEEVA